MTSTSSDDLARALGLVLLERFHTAGELTLLGSYAGADGLLLATLVDSSATTAAYLLVGLDEASEASLLSGTVDLADLYHRQRTTGVELDWSAPLMTARALEVTAEHFELLEVPASLV